MNALNQLREGLSRAWETLAEGWRELRERASDAITQFYPPTSKSDVESREERVARSGARWGVLAAEISEDDDVVRVTLEIPGMSAEDFDIRVEGDVLIVSGEKRVARDEQLGRYYVMERAYGRFQRAVRLPATVDDGKAKAKYTDGVLRLTLPKTGLSKLRRISVS